MARKILIEVEIPEGLEEEAVKLYIQKSMRKLNALKEMQESEEPQQNEEIGELLKTIKRRVAERSA